MLSGLTPQESDVTAAVKKLVPYSNSSDSSGDVSSGEARAADVESDLVLRGSAPGALESCYRRLVHIPKRMHYFSEAPRLVLKPDSETTSEDSSTNGGVLDDTQLNNAVLLSPDEHNLLLHVKTTAAHRQTRRQHPVCIGLAF